MSTAETLLGRLTDDRYLQVNKRVALCPVHDDRSPSSGDSKNREETISVKCWARCPVDQVLSGAGLWSAFRLKKPAAQWLKPIFSGSSLCDGSCATTLKSLFAADYGQSTGQRTSRSAHLRKMAVAAVPDLNIFFRLVT